eukprot:superscaffoldBa00009007_g23793
MASRKVGISSRAEWVGIQYSLQAAEQYGCGEADRHGLQKRYTGEGKLLKVRWQRAQEAKNIQRAKEECLSSDIRTHLQWDHETQRRRDKIGNLEIENKLQQRKPEQYRFRRLQNQQEIVRERLTAINREQALSAALREEQRCKSDEARRRAELERQQKEREKKAALLESISAHRKEQIKEREQRRNAELQSSRDWLQVQKQSDRLLIKREQLKTQRIREENIKLQSFNASLAAEQRSRYQQQKKEEHDNAVKNTEQIAEREKKHQQYIQRELLTLQSKPVLPAVRKGGL